MRNEDIMRGRDGEKEEGKWLKGSDRMHHDLLWRWHPLPQMILALIGGSRAWEQWPSFEYKHQLYKKDFAKLERSGFGAVPDEKE